MTDKEKELQAEAIGYYRKRIAELEKENAKLQGLVNQYKTSKCGSISLVNRNMIMFDQLTKAKVCLEQLVNEITVGELEVEPNVLQQAENFLKEE